MFCMYPLVPQQYSPLRSVAPRSVVVMLGAGASSDAGCPLVRGFIDRAKDILASQALESQEQSLLKWAIERRLDYGTRLRITEEDLDNIENLLAVADLEDLVTSRHLDRQGPEGDRVSQGLRRFIELIINRSTHLPDPQSRDWVETAQQQRVTTYKGLLTALALASARVSIVTLNYDCVVEYCAHCMGVPFTYTGEAGALPVYKLHGSINWTKCTNKTCTLLDSVVVQPVTHFPGAGQFGSVQVPPATCSKCGQIMAPVIVPPTHSKRYDEEIVRNSWALAFDALRSADVFVSVGYSLPEADSAVRNLLHLGLSQGALTEAVIVVGKDTAAAERWTSLFRSSWGNNRLKVRDHLIAGVPSSVLAPILHLPNDLHMPKMSLPPLGFWTKGRDDRTDAISRLLPHANMNLDAAWKMAKDHLVATRTAQVVDDSGFEFWSKWGPRFDALPIEHISRSTALS